MMVRETSWLLGSHLAQMCQSWCDGYANVWWQNSELTFEWN